jgi:hypothetical protein
LEFGDDALRQEIEARITDIVKREILRMLHDPGTYAYDFENAVARSMKNFLNSPRNTY